MAAGSGCERRSVEEKRMSRFLSWGKHFIRNWRGQAAGAAAMAMFCFVSMLGIFLHLSEHLPDGSQIHERTGLYQLKPRTRGEPISSIGGEASFCRVTAFRQGHCMFQGNDKTVTISVTKFPNMWGDVDVVLVAKAGQEMLTDEGLEGRIKMWKDQSLANCLFFPVLAFFLTFVGLRGLRSHIQTKEQES